MDEKQLVRLDLSQSQAPHLVVLWDADLLEAFLAGRRPTTLRAYSNDLADFAAFLRLPTASAVVKALIALPVGRANALALGNRGWPRGWGREAIGRGRCSCGWTVRPVRAIRLGWTPAMRSCVEGPGAAGRG